MGMAEHESFLSDSIFLQGDSPWHVLHGWFAHQKPVTCLSFRVTMTRLAPRFSTCPQTHQPRHRSSGSRNWSSWRRRTSVCWLECSCWSRLGGQWKISPCRWTSSWRVFRRARPLRVRLCQSKARRLDTAAGGFLCKVYSLWGYGFVKARHGGLIQQQVAFSLPKVYSLWGWGFIKARQRALIQWQAAFSFNGQSLLSPRIRFSHNDPQESKLQWWQLYL